MIRNLGIFRSLRIPHSKESKTDETVALQDRLKHGTRSILFPGQPMMHNLFCKFSFINITTVASHSYMTSSDHTKNNNKKSANFIFCF